MSQTPTPYVTRTVAARLGISESAVRDLADQLDEGVHFRATGSARKTLRFSESGVAKLRELAGLPPEKGAEKGAAETIDLRVLRVPKNRRFVIAARAAEFERARKDPGVERLTVRVRNGFACTLGALLPGCKKDPRTGAYAYSGKAPRRWKPTPTP